MEATLFNTIKVAINQAIQDNRPVAAKRYKALMRPLVPFVKSYTSGSEDISLLEVVSGDFVARFRNYLIEEYSSGQRTGKSSDSTVERHLNNLKALLRNAIEPALIPNVKVIHDVDDCNEVELKTLKPLVAANFDKVVKEFDKSCEISESRDVYDAATIAAARIKSKKLGLYLFGLLCGGLGIGEALRIRPEDFNEGRLTISKYGISIDVPEIVEALYHKYVAPYLVSPDTSEADEQALATRAASVEKNLGIMFQAMGIETANGLHDSAAFWLELARQKGASPRLVRLASKVVANHITEHEPGAIDAFGKLVGIVAQGIKTHIRNWFAIKCVGINNEELSATLHTFDDVELFVPKDMLARKKNKKIEYYNNPIVDKLLFAKSTYSQAKLIQKDIRANGVIMGIRSGNTKTFSVIPDKQMENFMRFLKVADEKLIIFDPSKKYKGKRVRITQGRFKDCIGKIVNLKVGAQENVEEGDGNKKRKVVKCFMVVLDNFCALGTFEFDSALVAEIRTPSLTA